MPIFVTAAIVLAQASSPAAAPAPKCTGVEYAAFDFWVGEWDVAPSGKDTPIARSTIEKLYEGCAVRESWMPLRGGGGGSLSGYDPDTGLWTQTWIGSAPGPVYFSGGIVGGAMVLTGRWKGSGPRGADGLTRMTYTWQNDGSVRQHGEFSADHGLTWQTSFDLIYRSRKE